MNYENQGHIIRIKDMLFSVLYRWKTVVVWALVLALLAGGYSAFTTYQIRSNEALLAQYAEEDAAAQEDYDDKKAILEYLVENAEKQVEEQTAYLENSLLMNVDYHSVAVAHLGLFVSTDYQIMPGMIYQNPDTTKAVVSAYAGLLTSKETLNAIADEMEMDTKYLEELITVKTDAERMLNVYVYHENEESACRITAMLATAMESYSAKVTESVGANTVTKVLDTVGITVDTDLANKQQAEKDLLQRYRDNLQTQQDKLNQLPGPALHQIPQMSNSIKWLVIGGVVGAVLVVVCLCVAFLVSDKLYGAEVMQMLYGTHILGGASETGGKCGAVNRWLKKKEGRVFKNTLDNDRLLSANISSRAGDHKQLLVTGSAESKEVAQLLERLQVQDVKLCYHGSVLTSADAMQALQECDGVLLAETCGKSTCRQIRKTLDCAANAGKPVIGAILFE